MRFAGNTQSLTEEGISPEKKICPKNKIDVRFFGLLLILFTLLSTLNTCSVQGEPTILYIRIHRIQKVDEIEGPSAVGAHWDYYISVSDGIRWLPYANASNIVGDDAIVDKTYTFNVGSTVASVYIGLLRHYTIDNASRWDLADISSYSGGGLDNVTTNTDPNVARGAVYQGNYDLKTNQLTGDQVFVEDGYYKTSGVFDGSVSTNEHDANLWFMIWDNYNAPTANAGPNQTVYKGDRINFDGSGSYASDGSIITSYAWDFDADSITDFYGMRASYTYYRRGNYTVTLKVTDNFGETNIDTCLVTVLNREPVASFTYTPQSPTIRDIISFNDTSSDSDGSIISWYWEFGDGNTSTERNSTHKYSDKGLYTVRLSVTDNDGGTNSTAKIIKIANLNPIANFTYSPMQPLEKEEVQFLDNSSDPEGKLTYWSWVLGDGYNSTMKNPVHQYLDSGNYTVILTVIDDEGATATTSKLIKVFKENIPPVLSILSPTNGTFFNSSYMTVKWDAFDPEPYPSGIDHYEVFLDNGVGQDVGTTTVKNFTEVSDGNHMIMVKAFDKAGNSKVEYLSIIVDTMPPILNITLPLNGEICSSKNITVSWVGYDTTSGIDHYEIKLDDTSWIDAEKSVNRTFDNLIDGNHTVYIKAFDKVSNFIETSTRFTIDTTVPFISVTSPINDSEIKSSTVHAAWNGSDAVSGIDHFEIKVDEGRWINVGTVTNYTLTDLSDGKHKVEVKVFDKVGLSQVDSVNFIVNTSFIGGPGWIDDIVFFGAITAVILTTILFYTWRKKRTQIKKV